MKFYNLTVKSGILVLRQKTRYYGDLWEKFFKKNFNSVYTSTISSPLEPESLIKKTMFPIA